PPPAPPHLSPLSLHDALPISEDRGGEHVLRKLALGEQAAHVAADVDPHSLLGRGRGFGLSDPNGGHSECDHQDRGDENEDELRRDRKSTRLNSSHEWISYAVF